MQYAKHGDRHGVPQHVMHQRAAPMLLGEAIAVRNESAPPAQLQLRLAAEELDAEVVGEERPAPAIVIPAHERDRDASGANLLQLGDRGEVFAGNDALVLEPEVEQVTHQYEVVPRLRDLLEKRVERFPDGGRHLAEVRVRHDDHTSRLALARHGPSLGSWNHARKRITVLS